MLSRDMWVFGGLSVFHRRGPQVKMILCILLWKKTFKSVNILKTKPRGIKNTLFLKFFNFVLIDYLIILLVMLKMKHFFNSIVNMTFYYLCFSWFTIYKENIKFISCFITIYWRCLLRYVFKEHILDSLYMCFSNLSIILL